MKKYKDLYINEYARSMNVPKEVTIINPQIRDSFNKRLEDIRKALQEEKIRRDEHQKEIIKRNLSKRNPEEAHKELINKSGAKSKNRSTSEIRESQRKYREMLEASRNRGFSTLREQKQGGKRKTKRHRKKHKKTKTPKHKKDVAGMKKTKKRRSRSTVEHIEKLVLVYFIKIKKDMQSN